MNIKPAIGIVMNIAHGSAAQPQFPSLASDPQKTNESAAPAIKGITANTGERTIASNPVFGLSTEDRLLSAIVLSQTKDIRNLATDEVIYLQPLYFPISL